MAATEWESNVAEPVVSGPAGMALPPSAAKQARDVTPQRLGCGSTMSMGCNYSLFNEAPSLRAARLAADLKDPEASMRRAAAAALGALGKAAVPYAELLLAMALSDSHEQVRYTAALALGALGEAHWPHAAQLATALRDAGVEARRCAAHALDADSTVGAFDQFIAASSPGTNLSTSSQGKPVNAGSF